MNIRHRLIGRAIAPAIILIGVFAGCAPQPESQTESQPAWNEKQQRTLDDPMNYRPEFEETNISGGDMGTFDRKAFKRDMDSLFLK